MKGMVPTTEANSPLKRPREPSLKYLDREYRPNQIKRILASQSGHLGFQGIQGFRASRSEPLGWGPFEALLLSIGN